VQLYLTGKHFKIVPRLRKHLEEHLEKLNRYDRQIISANVVFKTQKYFNIAEITVKASHFNFYGEGSSDDNMFAAVDLAIHRVEAQLKKHRAKMKGLKKKSRRAPRTSRRTREALKLVSSEAFAPKPMSSEEASLQLGVTEKHFLVFQNSKSKKINVIYKREDGYHGLVEPEV